MSRILNYKIEEEYDGRRAGSYLRGRLGFSARVLKDLKNSPGGILLDGSPIRTIDPLRAGSVLSLSLPGESPDIEPLEYPLDVVFEDEDILVVNKSAGLAMHPTHNHQGDTLANAVAWYLAGSGRGGVFRSVGRLDKGTSGLVICALNRYAASRLTDAMLAKSIKKTYLAAAGGYFDGGGTIDAPIYRPDPMKTIRRAGINPDGPEGERAVTHWKALISGKGASLLSVSPETGRTHQIRVHFAYLGAPLLGDDMYGGDCSLITRPALHCGRIQFPHPVTGAVMELAQEMPEDMQRIF